MLQLRPKLSISLSLSDTHTCEHTHTQFSNTLISQLKPMFLFLSLSLSHPHTHTHTHTHTWFANTVMHHLKPKLSHSVSLSLSHTHARLHAHACAHTHAPTRTVCQHSDASSEAEANGTARQSWWRCRYMSRDGHYVTRSYV